MNYGEIENQLEVLKINSNIESTSSDVKQNCSSFKDFKKQFRDINDGFSFSEYTRQTKFISKTLFESIMEKNPRKIIFDGIKHKEKNENSFFRRENASFNSSINVKQKKFFTFNEEGMISKVKNNIIPLNRSMSIIRDNNKHKETDERSNDILSVSVEFKIKQRSHNQDPDTPSKWKKVKNFLKGLENFFTFSTRNIDETLIKKELVSFVEVQKLRRNSKSDTKSNNTVQTNADETNNQIKKEPKADNLVNQNKDIYIFFLKEKFRQIILEGGKENIPKLRSILKQIRNTSLKEKNNPNFIFSQPLSDNKTLLYIACREGKYDIVKFMLDNKFDPKIKSAISDIEDESCLQVASRWGYVKIVALLLEKISYSKEEIIQSLQIVNLSIQIKNLLTQYYTNRFKISKGCCLSFLEY